MINLEISIRPESCWETYLSKGSGSTGSQIINFYLFVEDDATKCIKSPSYFISEHSPLKEIGLNNLVIGYTVSQECFDSLYTNIDQVFKDNTIPDIEKLKNIMNILSSF